MTEHLFLRLTEDPDRFAAAVLAPDGRLLRPIAVLPAAAIRSLAENRRVSVVVPAGRVVVLAATLPKASGARLRSLLPYSLEDHFAADVEDLHFAAGPAMPDGRRSASVVERELIEAWLARLDAAGLGPAALYAASDGVPDMPSTTTLVVDDGAILGRRPGQPPFQLDGLGLDEVVDLLAADETAAPDLRHLMIYGTRDGLDRCAAEIEALRARPGEVDVRQLPDGPFGLIAGTLLGSGGTNLLQGEYAPRSNVRAALKPWAAAAGLAGALLAVTLVGGGIELLRLRAADARLSDQTASLCTERFGIRSEADCRAEAQRRLAVAGQTVDSTDLSFLSVLDTVAEATDLAGFEALSYRNRTLDLDMIVPSVTALDEFSQRVGSDRAYQVRTLSNTPQDEGLRSRIQVVAAP